jgi:16S rRNA G527 N7-methylase RsmG
VRASSTLRDLVVAAGFAAPSDGTARLERYVELLRLWSRRMNLTASVRWERLAPLLEEAIWAAAAAPSDRVRHLDIGSGAGFPAVPIQILRPAASLELVEPRWKRAVFLETVAAELPLPGVRVHADRLDAFLARSRGGWECVSWKALRLGSRDLETLLAKLAPDAELWLFHGAALPVEEPAWLEAHCRLVRRAAIPGRAGSFRSIYTAVSRET